MRKLTTLFLISTFALSGCATLVEDDILTQSQPSPNDAYGDPNNTDELQDCIRDKKRKPQEPDCFLKN